MPASQIGGDGVLFRKNRTGGFMTPPWFLPIVLLAQSQPAPLHLVTPVTAVPVVVTVRTSRRDRSLNMERSLTSMDYRVRQAKYRYASPAPACNGNVCAIPVLQSLADNPFADP
jgi:hypothetical protein